MSMLLITHDLGIVTEIADRVVVMYAGEGVETGSAKDLLDNPNHPYTKGLISSRPHLGSAKEKRQRLTEISGSVPSPHQRPTGCAFHPRCDWSTEQCKTQKPLLQSTTQNRQFSCHLQPGSI